MKNLLLWFVLVLIVPQVVVAQVALIPKIGITKASLHSTAGGSDLQAITGLVAGVGVNLPVNQIWSLQPEVLYQQKGFRKGPDQLVRHTYLEIPLLLKVSLPGKALVPYLIGGPSAGLLLSSHYQQANGNSLPLRGRNIAIQVNEMLETHTEQNSAFHKAELGVQLGAGASCPLGRGRALLELRYGQSLTDFFSMGSTAGTTRFTNRAIGLTLGYSLPLGKQ
jgi:hypothetical protein